MKTIDLGRGEVAFVDDSDFDLLSSNRWGLQKVHSCRYAVRCERNDQGKWVPVLMLRTLAQPPKGFEVDHIDGNGLNNQRSNLRLVTHQQNIQNRLKRKMATSKFKGVWKIKNRWKSGIKTLGRTIHLGSFRNEVDAALAYDCAAKRLFGQFARINFPISV